MKYTVNYERKARKQLSKMDSSVSKKIYAWVDKHLEGCDNPRALGKALTGNWAGYWRYRVGDYRLIADIQDDKIIIVIAEVAHRKEIYKEARA